MYISSGITIPSGISITNPVIIDILLIGGGGGGGGGDMGGPWMGGGGGAGGYLYNTTNTFAIGETYTITVGDGATAAGSGSNGVNGNDSTVIGSGVSLTALGGGGGACNQFNFTTGAGGSGIVIVRYPGNVQFYTGGAVTYANGHVVHTFYVTDTLAPTTPTAIATSDYQISRSIR